MLKASTNYAMHILSILLVLGISGCDQDGDCDRDFYVEMTGLDMLEEAEIVNCDDKFEWLKIAAFQLNDAQVRELLDSKNFEPVRSSLEMVNFPLKWVNKLFEEIDELSQYRKTQGSTDCTMTLKEDDKLLIVSIADPDWSGN